MSRKYTVEEVRLFVEQNGNGDILLSENYIDSHSKINLLCGKCKSPYFIRYSNYKEGHRCFNCTHKQIWNYHANRNITNISNLKTCFPELLCEWDYELNSKLPEQYSLYSNYSVYWICKKCGYKYKSVIANRTKGGNGCPLCRETKIEKKVKIILKSNNILFNFQKSFLDCMYKKRLRFDFYLFLHNILIETQGRQHYVPIDFAGKGSEWANIEFEKNQIRDQIKRDYCKNNGIKLIEIPYWDYDKIEEILTHELNL